jgi:hypothetical protein
MSLSAPRSFALLAGIVLMAALPAEAQPNFSGKWKLDIAKSDFGPMPPPTSQLSAIVHTGSDLKVSVQQSNQMGDFAWEATYTTDGKECANEIRGNPMKSKVTWDGDTLVFDTRGSFQGNEVTISDKWTLSSDGKTLTSQRHFASSMGEADSKLILEKQ